MSIDTYKLTSMEEPTDEVLSQLMREAAEEARETNAQATLPQTSDSHEPDLPPVNQFLTYCPPGNERRSRRADS